MTFLREIASRFWLAVMNKVWAFRLIRARLVRIVSDKWWHELPCAFIFTAVAVLAVRDEWYHEAPFLGIHPLVFVITMFLLVHVIYWLGYAAFKHIRLGTCACVLMAALGIIILKVHSFPGEFSLQWSEWATETVEKPMVFTPEYKGPQPPETTYAASYAARLLNGSPVSRAEYDQYAEYYSSDVHRGMMAEILGIEVSGLPDPWGSHIRACSIIKVPGAVIRVPDLVSLARARFT